MSQSDRAIKKLATQLARLDREVKSWRGAQADYTSIEAGTMDINDSDGNLVSRVGFQDDGSGAVRFFDGPVPPVPAGVTATADGPIIQATWDGTFEGGAEATYDLAYLEVAATQVDDASNVSFATITAKEGASASVVADVTGDWVVAVRSVSQAGKKSEFATAGTVEVKLTDVAGAIEDVQQSANGKNKVTYSSHAPTENDPGIFDDTWFVGQVGRPNDVIEGKNRVLNPSANPAGSSWTTSTGSGTTTSMSSTSRNGLDCFRATLTGGTSYVYLVAAASSTSPSAMGEVTPGETLSAGMLVACANATSLSIRMGFRDASGGFVAWSSIGPSVSVPADGDLVQLKLEDQVVPAGAVAAYVHVTNSDSAAWVEGTRAIITQGSTLPDFFDGDTPSGETDNEPHYRWTGTPHASTSEKFLPALDIGESSNWNIIEQYRHDGNGWVKVELSHYVFSTVDLGKATVGELDGIRIMAKTISGDLFTGDAFDGIVFRGNTFTTRDGNGEFSDRGLFFQKPDGTSIFRVPTDGTPISMSASDVQIERAQVDELELNIGRVRSGGLLELSSGVTPPASPPELNAAWARVTTLQTPTPGLAYDWLGLGYWANGDAWVRAVNVLGSEGDSFDVVEVYDSATGELVKSISTGLNPRSGVTVIGDVAYVMGPDYLKSNIGKQWVHGFDLNTGERVTRWEFVNFFDPKQAKVALGSDGTNLVAAGVAPNLSLNVFRYNPSTGAQVGAQWLSAQDWPPSGGKELYGVRINGNEVEVVTSWGGRVYLNSNNALVRKTDTANASGYAGWVLPAHDVSGCVWVSGVPYPVDSNGTVYEGSVSASDYTREMCFTWYDGTHETTASPVATIDVGARETVTISLPVRAGLQKRLYSRATGGSGNWSRSVVPADVTVSPAPVGIAVFTPPSTNSFPDAAPATLKSTNDKFEVRGDGSGHWGNFNVDANGTMSGLIATGEIVVAVDEGGTAKQFTINLPPGRFTKPPVVWAQASTGYPQLVSVGVPVVEITPTTFGLYFYRANTTATRVSWFAMDSE